MWMRVAWLTSITLATQLISLLAHPEMYSWYSFYFDEIFMDLNVHEIQYILKCVFA